MYLISLYIRFIGTTFKLCIHVSSPFAMRRRAYVMSYTSVAIK